VACACATLERAEAFAAALTRDLDRCATLEREIMTILAELAALTAGGIWQVMVYNPASPSKDASIRFAAPPRTLMVAVINGLPFFAVRCSGAFQSGPVARAWMGMASPPRPPNRPTAHRGHTIRDRGQSASVGCVLGLLRLGTAKTEKEAHGEFESEHPGYCGAGHVLLRSGTYCWSVRFEANMGFGRSD
jgi:hypothetical protein